MENINHNFTNHKFTIDFLLTTPEENDFTENNEDQDFPGEEKFKKQFPDTYKELTRQINKEVNFLKKHGIKVEDKRICLYRNEAMKLNYIYQNNLFKKDDYNVRSTDEGSQKSRFIWFKTENMILAKGGAVAYEGKFYLIKGNKKVCIIEPEMEGVSKIVKAKQAYALSIQNLPENSKINFTINEDKKIIILCQDKIIKSVGLEPLKEIQQISMKVYNWKIIALKSANQWLVLQTSQNSFGIFNIDKNYSLVEEITVGDKDLNIQSFTIYENSIFYSWSRRAPTMSNADMGIHTYNILSKNNPVEILIDSGTITDFTIYNNKIIYNLRPFQKSLPVKEKSIIKIFCLKLNKELMTYEKEGSLDAMKLKNNKLFISFVKDGLSYDQIIEFPEPPVVASKIKNLRDEHFKEFSASSAPQKN